MTRTADDADSRTMLISIRPEHVASILAGDKTIELRRRRPSVQPGDNVLIYTTTPVAALTVRCRVRAVESLAPATLWARYSDQVGISLDRFDDYFAGSDSATALHLCDVQALDRTVTLAELRQSGPFQPPQTWHFLEPARVEFLLGTSPTSVAAPLDSASPLALLVSALKALLARTAHAALRHSPR